MFDILSAARVTISGLAVRNGNPGSGAVGGGIAEDSRTVVNSAALMAAKHDLNVGQTYFLLYRNTRGAVKNGTAVTH